MSTKIEHPVTFVPSFEKVLSQNSQLAEKFIGVFKKVMTNLSNIPETAKTDIHNITKDYLETTFHDLQIVLPNLTKLNSFLVKYVDSIQPIISACTDMRHKFPDAGLRLLYEVESADLSGEENVTLYVKGIPMNSAYNEEFKEIASKYKEYFIDSGVLFTIQFDTLRQ